MNMLRRGRKHYVTATVAVLLSVGAAVLVTMKWRPEPASWDPTTAMAASGDRTGKIVLKHGDTCQTLTFDNDTGKVSAVASTCPDVTPVDAAGLPIPAGTTRRLNAISGSFGNGR